MMGVFGVWAIARDAAAIRVLARHVPGDLMSKFYTDPHEREKVGSLITGVLGLQVKLPMVLDDGDLAVVLYRSGKEIDREEVWK